MHLVVGLGNPGPKYAATRHNVGFRVLERLLSEAGGAELRDKFKGRWAKLRLDGEDVVVLAPMTYMNLSGESVQAALSFFQLSIEQVLVVHDELDLPFGTLRLKKGGGAAGHNGLRSIIAHCGPDFARLRVGIGRPAVGPLERWVLSGFDESEGAELPTVLDEAARAVRAVLADGLPAAMNAVNTRKS